MNFDDVKHAVLTGSAESGATGILTIPGDAWTPLGDSGFEIHADLPAHTEWAVAVGWPGSTWTAVAARLQVPGLVADWQFVEPLVLLDADPKPGEVVMHHVTRYPGDEHGSKLNHVMIRKAG